MRRPEDLTKLERQNLTEAMAVVSMIIIGDPTFSSSAITATHYRLDVAVEAFYDLDHNAWSWIYAIALRG